MLQRVDQVDRRIKTNPLALQRDTGNAQCCGQVGLPVPGPPMSTAFCAVCVKSSVANCLITLSSTFDRLKSNPAISRWIGKRAAFIWWLMERMARSVCSACSRCSINHFDVAIPVSPRATQSVQALARPLRRNSLSSVGCHSACWAFRLRAQAVVANRVGLWGLREFQARLDAIRLRLGVQPDQHIENVLDAECARFHHPLHGHQHRLQSSRGHAGEHLRHDFVATCTA